ncbi:glycosyl transferase family 4 [Thermosphaera chiliense]|uniref:UDP-N-acetylglucosamine--dolichyl-phosphate N-acetylglucosaminephosphotransferase n=1 Tax=Thermosphaera chiliense TaxID=3402707 RepID=A0A7M1UPM9_9CREN|nr:glycosyltransferase 4 family protein [Thermosphaera aggregans]QOR94161.1 glycosyl transferase family 4 [Thermosphaera aggregans]
MEPVDALEVSLPLLISAASTYILLKWWIPKSLLLGFKGKDMNKYGYPEVSEAGGIWVILSAAISILVYIAIATISERDPGNLHLLATTQVLILAGLLGFIDDILGWKKGISPIARVLFTIPIALPLMAVKAGYSVVEIPFIGPLDLGLLYPLIVVPIGVVGASNAFNMLAGYNGLEASQGIVILSFTCLFLLKKNMLELIPVMLPVIASLLVFLIFNKYPAKVLPGNSFTYGLGAFYASVVIYGNFERFGLLMFTLYFLEFALFLRGLANGVYKENFGIPQEDGGLNPPYRKSYSVTHIALKTMIRVKGKATEKDVVNFICLLQIVIGLIGLWFL